MLYGKWRPRSFDEVVGQDHIVTTLRNALQTGQTAHAYLFSGPRGTGKTTTARILARALNCLSLTDGDPCGVCAVCEAIMRGSDFELLVEIDAASNRGIDDVRELKSKIATGPGRAEGIGFVAATLKKVYLIDEVHMLTQQAFNALLKTLEEPPPHAYFILATTEYHNVPPTIISRCQRYDFRRVPVDAIVERLRTISAAEGYALPDEGLTAVALQARGGLRDAITLLEQVVARYGERPSTDDVLAALGLVHDPRSERLAAAVLEGNLGDALEIAAEVADDGLDIARFTRETVEVMRTVLRAVVRNQGDLAQYGDLLAQAKARPTSVRVLSTAIAELAKADFRLDPASAVPLEVACATAILGSAVAVAAQQPLAPGSLGGGQTRPAAGRLQGSAAPAADEGEVSPEERFLRELMNSLRVVNFKAAAHLNDSCRVLTIGQDRLELGFFYPVHMGRIASEFREDVEAAASSLLARPVELELKLIEKGAVPRRQAKGGHLLAAARELGATPVAKEGP